MHYHLKLRIIALTGCILLGCTGQSEDHSESGQTTPTPTYGYQLELAANSWVESNPEQTRQLVTADGIRNWQHSQDVIQVYFHTETTGDLELSLTGQAITSPTRLEVELNSQLREVQFTDTAPTQLALGQFQISEPGYQRLVIRGISSPSKHFAQLDQLLINSKAGQVRFIDHDDYWGRRGPSVHLGYQPATDSAIEWFYSEITVPEGYDALGSFFMANGFADGYFGIQVNSATERRVLFSVWSPYETDDPTTIPTEYQVKLLDKGLDVVSGEFGNEGSGGQSYLRFPWQTDTAYGFLLRGHPIANNYTEYSAWFYAPELGSWQFIARFKRPKTQRYIERPHSFLENFLTETGDTTRKAYYHSQWFKTTEGDWLEATEARFTGDATAQSQNRLDFAGGSTGAKFYLQNTGFFSPHTPLNSNWQRTPTAKPTLVLPPK